jgi:hypothetical protein
MSSDAAAGSWRSVVPSYPFIREFRDYCSMGVHFHLLFDNYFKRLKKKASFRLSLSRWIDDRHKYAYEKFSNYCKAKWNGSKVYIYQQELNGLIRYCLEPMMGCAVTNTCYRATLKFRENILKDDVEYVISKLEREYQNIAFAYEKVKRERDEIKEALETHRKMREELENPEKLAKRMKHFHNPSVDDY